MKKRRYLSGMLALTLALGQFNCGGLITSFAEPQDVDGQIYLYSGAITTEFGDVTNHDGGYAVVVLSTGTQTDGGEAGDISITTGSIQSDCSAGQQNWAEGAAVWAEENGCSAELTVKGDINAVSTESTATGAEVNANSDEASASLSVKETQELEGSVSASGVDSCAVHGQAHSNGSSTDIRIDGDVTSTASIYALGVRMEAGSGASGTITVGGDVSVSAGGQEDYAYGCEGVNLHSYSGGAASADIGGDVSALADTENGYAEACALRSDTYDSTNTASVGGNVEAAGAMAVGVSLSNTATADGSSAQTGAAAAEEEASPSVDVTGNVSASGKAAIGIAAEAEGEGALSDVHVGGNVTADGRYTAVGIVTAVPGGEEEKAAAMPGGADADTGNAPASIQIDVDGKVIAASEYQAAGVVTTADPYAEPRNIIINVGEGIEVSSAYGTGEGGNQISPMSDDFGQYSENLAYELGNPLIRRSATGINVVSIYDDVSITVGDEGIKVSAKGMMDPAGPEIANGIVYDNLYGNLNIDVNGTVQSDMYGMYILDGNVTGSMMFEMQGETPEAAAGSTAVSIHSESGEADLIGGLIGIVDGRNLADNETLNTTADILVDGTVKGDLTSVAVDQGTTADNFKLTVWKIELSKNGNVIETRDRSQEQGQKPIESDALPAQNTSQQEEQPEFHATDATRALEKTIQYIIKVEQPSEGAQLSACYSGGKALSTSHDLPVARENEKVLLKIDLQEGFELTGAYNGKDGMKIDLCKDEGGNYYVIVPKGGGVYLSASLKTTEKPVPKPEPGPTPAPPTPAPEPTPAPTPKPAVKAWDDSEDDELAKLSIGEYFKEKTKISPYTDPLFSFIGKDGSKGSEWINHQGRVYYADSSTRFAQVGWRFIEGFWYYFQKDGSMATGWITVEGKQYYLNPETNGSIPYGALFTDTVLPDGTFVNLKGERI